MNATTATKDHTIPVVVSCGADVHTGMTYDEARHEAEIAGCHNPYACAEWTIGDDDWTHPAPKPATQAENGDQSGLTSGQTFRQRGGRLLHIYSGPVTRTLYSYDGPPLLGGEGTPYQSTYYAAACGASYQPEKGDQAEVSDRKVCAKCQRATA